MAIQVVRIAAVERYRNGTRGATIRYHVAGAVHVVTEQIGDVEECHEFGSPVAARHCWRILREMLASLGYRRVV